MLMTEITQIQFTCCKLYSLIIVIVKDRPLFFKVMFGFRSRIRGWFSGRRDPNRPIPDKTVPIGQGIRGHSAERTDTFAGSVPVPGASFAAFYGSSGIVVVRNST